jgi:hypothetical protein
MAENKTQATRASADAFLEKIPDEGRRKDCKTLVKIMKSVTGEKPVMWGPSMVGFGSYHYKYESGREGDMFVAGFAPRKSDLTIYGMGGLAGREALLKKLGKHKASGGCLHIKSFADIDLDVLETLIQRSVEKHRPRADKQAR